MNGLLSDITKSDEFSYKRKLQRNYEWILGKASDVFCKKKYREEKPYKNIYLENKIHVG